MSAVSSNLRTHHSLNVVNPRFQLVTGRVWRGTAFGGVKGRTEIPGLVQGKLTEKSRVVEIGFLFFQITLTEK